jgi:hypothetical protein
LDFDDIIAQNPAGNRRKAEKKSRYFSGFGKINRNKIFGYEGIIEFMTNMYSEKRIVTIQSCLQLGSGMLKNKKELHAKRLSRYKEL